MLVVAANKQKSEDVNTAVDTADTPEFEPHDEQKVKMVEETMEREADQDIERSNLEPLENIENMKHDKDLTTHAENVKTNSYTGDQRDVQVGNDTSALPPVAGDEDEDSESSTGMAKALAGEKVAPTDMNYWKPGFPRGFNYKKRRERTARVITDFNGFRRKPEDMPKPQPDPDDLELYGDMTNEPNPSALRARILLRAARLYRVGTHAYNEVDELTRTILHKVDLTRQKLSHFIKQILLQTQNKRDQIIMEKLLVTMYTSG